MLEKKATQEKKKTTELPDGKDQSFVAVEVTPAGSSCSFVDCSDYAVWGVGSARKPRAPSQ